MMTAIVFGLASCSDDEVTKTPLLPTSISEGAKTVSTLSFSWTPVADATQSYPTWTVADGTVEVADICILEDYGTTTGYSCISIYKRSGYVYLYWTDYTDGSTEYYNAVEFWWE